MKKIVLILLLAVLNPLFSIELRTLIFSDYYGQIEPDSSYESIRQRNYIRPELSMDLFNETAKLTVSAEFYYDNFTQEKTPNLFNILRECYMTFYLDWGDIIIGQKFTTKGKADAFSPLNIFNASYKELLSLDEPYQGKRSELGLELRYYIDDESSIELLYIPFPRPDYQGSGKLSVKELALTLEKDSDSYIFKNAHSIFLTYNKYAYLFDTQLTYACYVDGNYNFVKEPPILKKTYNRVHTIGGAISSSIGNVSITEDFAFNLTEDFNGKSDGIKNSDITFNTQLMKTLFGRTYAQINIVYQHIFNYKETDDYGKAVYNTHLQPTDNIMFFIGHLHDSFLREKLYVALNIGFFFSPDVYLGPRVNYKINDVITLESGLNIYTGKYKQKLLEENLGGDNFYIRIKYEY